MSEKLDPKRIGGIGQKAFETWAEQANIVANPSISNDERGWDILLQLPSDPKDLQMGVWDRALPEISCMIQIKTTTSLDQFEAITLSNWQRMIREPMPWFVAAIHLDAEHQPSQAYLIHIGREWCQKVLIRLRELAKKKKGHLNAHTLNVTWNDADKLPRMHGKALIERIRDCVQPNQFDYVNEKVNWFKNLGYRNKQKKVNIQFEVEDKALFLSELSDLGAGLRSTLPRAWRASVSDVRFGIEAAFSEFGVESGEMEFQAQPLMLASFEVFNERTTSLIFVDCQFYRAGVIFPSLPPKFDKSRIVHKYFECILGRSETGKFGAIFKIYLPPQEPITVDDMRMVVSLLVILIENDKHPVGIGINGRRINNFFLSNQFKFKGNIDDLEILNLGAGLCSTFGVPSNSLVIPESLYMQRDTIKFICTALKAENEPINIQVPFKHGVNCGKLFGLITLCFLQLENIGLLVASGFYGPVTNSEERDGLGCRITIEKCLAINEKKVIQMKDFENSKELQLETIQKNLVTRLQKLGCEFIHIYEPKSQEDNMEI